VLAERSTEAELMDNAGLSAAEYARCLRDLATVNRVTLTHGSTLRWLGRATRALPAGATVSVLDVACGGGDLLRAIRRWADRRGLHARLEGIDLNPRSTVVARAATPADAAIVFRTGDVFAYRPDPAPDFIVTSQFAHHLAETELIRLLAWLEAHAARGWYIADLHRHGFAHWGFPLLGRIAGWHPIVRHDGQVSIARSFRRTDWERLLAASGLTAEIRWHLPFRLCVGRLK